MSQRIRFPFLRRGSTAALAWFLAYALLQGPTVQAGITGSQGFSIGNPVGPVLSPGGSNLLTATSIELGTLITSGSSTGDFATYVTAGDNVGDPTLTMSTPTTFTFGDSTFGTVTGSSILMDSSLTFMGSYYREIEIAGMYSPGTDFSSLNPGLTPVDFTVTLTQTAPNGSVGDGGTVFVSAVPEPSSIGMLLLGAAGVAIGYYRRIRPE